MTNTMETNTKDWERVSEKLSKKYGRTAEEMIGIGLAVNEALSSQKQAIRERLEKLKGLTFMTEDGESRKLGHTQALNEVLQILESNE